MSEHKGLPVAGYNPQSDQAVETVNANKRIEEELLRRLDAMMIDDAIEIRWLNIAQTHFEIGFMALNRSVFKPSRIPLPGDEANP